MKTLITIITSLITLFSFGQDSLKNHYTLSADISPYALNGYSIKVGIIPKSLPSYDFSTEIFSMEIPELVVELNNKNKGQNWEEDVNYGIALYSDRKLGNKSNSFWAGIGLVYLNQTAKNELESNSFSQIEALARVNYKWYPFNNGFYVNPYFALAGRQKLNGNNGSYELSPFMVISSIYLSWEF